MIPFDSYFLNGLKPPTSYAFFPPFPPLQLRFDLIWLAFVGVNHMMFVAVEKTRAASANGQPSNFLGLHI